ncbi:MAG: transglutaminase family protein [Candidatus Tectomicrobia bacterium]|uniref:Transglutaminase family protein n=1 Tax=Tectimicrobiota bacterium TaxID=2528274 RepID=A0A937W3M9_UNCTE|nr:transglutaminase family protein [Candidatus Tectomicrobia bacterium]
MSQVKNYAGCVRCSMKLQSPHLADCLTCTPISDWETPAIIDQTQAIIRGLMHDMERAQALFEWVRDAIPHSWDIGTDVVTCAAIQVLQQRTGLCYAKSHLLAAMLRSTGIPAGFCYQVFRRSPPYHGLALHGLNGLYLPSVARWVRVDARGNTGTIDAQFSLTAEQLAFPIDLQQGEFLYETIYTDPVPEVVAVLQGFTSLHALWPSLPVPFAEDSGAISAQSEARAMGYAGPGQKE